MLISSIAEEIKGEFQAGAVRAYSGSDGTVLLETLGFAMEGFGLSLDSYYDFDLDGIQDYLVGAGLADANGIFNSGSMSIVSGGTGERLLVIDGEHEIQQFGAQVVSTGDLTGDGISDFAVGSSNGTVQNGFEKSGFIGLYSGSDGRLVHQVAGEAEFAFMGAAMDAGFDADGDGRSEILTGAQQDFFSFANEGQAYVYSYRSFIEIDQRELSLAAGGTTTVDLEFPASEANLGYATLASMRGFGVTKVGGVQVPLKRDRLFDLMLAGDAPSYFQQAYGTLDQAATATALVVIPPNAPSALLGRSLSLSAISFSNHRVRRSAGGVQIEFEL